MDGPTSILIAARAGWSASLAETLPPLAATAKPAPALGAAAPHVDRLVSSIQAMPWLMHVGIALAFGAGLVLWLRGKPLFKPATAVLAAALGGVLGFALLPVLAPTATVPPWLGMLAGALAGGMLLLAMHRLLAATVFGGVLALAFATIATGTLTILDRSAPVGATAVAAAVEPATENAPALAALAQAPVGSPTRTGTGGEEQPIRSSSPEVAPPTAPGAKPAPRPATRTDPLPPKRGIGRLGGEDPSPHDPPAGTDQRATPAATKPAAPAKPAAKNSGTQADRTAGKPTGAPSGTAAPSRDSFDPESIRDSAAVASSARNLWSAGQERWHDRWEETPTGHRLWIIGAALLGAVGGTMAGILQPAWAAAVLSAIAGSGIAMISGIWLAHATGLPGHQKLTLTAVDFSVVWFTLAMIGIAAQWKFISDPAGSGRGKKGKRKPKPEPVDDDE